MRLSAFAFIKELAGGANNESGDKTLVLINLWTFGGDEMELGLVEVVRFVEVAREELFEHFEFFVPEFVLLENVFAHKGWTDRRFRSR